MSNHRLNVGIIGVGYWGKKIATEYTLFCKNNPSVKLVGVCDVFDENLEFCRQKLEIPYQTKELGEILNNRDLDAVHICTPSSTHYEICKMALNHDKHVTVEKPMTLKTSEALELVELAHKRGLVLSVGHIFRFDAAVEKARALFKENFFGDTYWIKLAWTAMMPPMTGRDIISDLAPHPFDILNFLTDEWPINVTCVAKAHRSGQKEETAYIISEFRNNLLAHIEISWLCPERRREIQIMGSKRYARIDCMTQKLAVYENDHYYELPIQRSNTINLELAHFVDCIHEARLLNHNYLNKNNGLVGANVVRLLELTRNALENKKTESVE